MDRRCSLLAFCLLTVLATGDAVLQGPVMRTLATAAGGGTPTFVQGAGGTEDGTDPYSQAYAGNVTSGNLVVVAAHKAGTTVDAFAQDDIAKSGGSAATLGTWTLDCQTNWTSGSYYLYCAIYSAPVTGTGSLTVEIDTVGNPFGGMAVMEFSGVDTNTTRIDVGAMGFGASGAPTTTSFNTSGKTAIVGDLMTEASGSETHTASADYTTLYEEEDGASHATGSIIYRTTSGSITGETTDWTAPTTIQWGCVAVSYKASP